MCTMLSNINVPQKMKPSDCGRQPEVDIFGADPSTYLLSPSQDGDNKKYWFLTQLPVQLITLPSLDLGHVP